LRQRAQEKDEQLSKLSKDREEMRAKLIELTKLVQQLVAEKEARCMTNHAIPVEHSVKNMSVSCTPQGEEGTEIIQELNYCRISLCFGSIFDVILFVFMCIFDSFCDVLRL